MKTPDWLPSRAKLDALAEALKNPEPAHPDDAAARQKICDGCDYHTPFNFCRKCGCAIAIKSRMLNGECPLGKWPLPRSAT